MPRRPKDPDKPQDTKAQILEAALKVFSEKGFKGATNEEIAREAGITPGLIYWYFDSKQALFNSLFERRSYVVPLTNWLKEHWEASPDLVLRGFGQQFLAVFEQEMIIRLFRLLLSESLRLRPLGEILSSQVYQRVIRTLSRYLAHQAELGRIRRADNFDIVAQGFVGGLISFIIMGRAIPIAEVLALPKEQIVEQMVAVFLAGLAVPGKGDGAVNP